MATGAPLILNTVAVLAILGCVVNWWSSWQRFRTGQPLLPFQPRDCVHWGLVDLGLFVLVLVASAGLGLKLTTSRLGIEDVTDTTSLPPNQQSALFLASGIAFLVATALSLGWVWSRFQHLDGFGRKHIAGDILLGLRWFSMLIVPVLLLQFLLSQWIPSRHPLIEMLRESGDTSYLVVAAFAAIVAAPIFEECYFRLFLQGWLEKLQITLERSTSGLSSQSDRDAVLWGGATSGELTVPPGSQPTEDRPTLWWPILVTSALFSISHWSHGPDFVPLFFLALGLGYLYQRSGRILPPMVVHFCVNTIGILQLCAEMNPQG